MPELAVLMSEDGTAEGQDKQVSPQFAKVQAELRKEDTLLNSILEQLPSMGGMALMFIVTIALGLWLRPWYDINGLQAFGESGATKVSNIALELSAIIVFTAGILLLAKYKKEWVIKWGIMGVLGIALMYTTVPMAHLATIDYEVQDYETTAEYSTSEAFLAQYENGVITTELIGDHTNWQDSVSYWQGTPFEGEPVWNHLQDRLPGNDIGDVRVSFSDSTATFTNGIWIWTMNMETGEVLDTYECFQLNLQGEAEPLGNLMTGCSLAVKSEQGLYIGTNDDRLVYYRTFDDSPGTKTYQASWALPTNARIGDGIITAQLIEDDRLLLVTEQLASIVNLDTQNHGISDSNQEVPPVDTSLVRNASGRYTSADFGYSPWSELTFDEQSEGENFLILGENNGAVLAYNWNYDAAEEVTLEDRMHLDGVYDSIQHVEISDVDDSGYADLLITSEDAVNWHYGASLTRLLSIDAPSDVTSVHSLGDIDEEGQLVIIRALEGSTSQSGELSNDMIPQNGIVIYTMPLIIGVIVALVLMILLIIHPEWYIVNTVGVMVGAGIVVMLGVSFVPSLIIIFMLAAAIYDAYAVYRSKHMLALADTMIGLRLPILLVAPQEKGYSFKEEQAPIQDDVETIPALATKPAKASKPKKKKSGQAMFMGLGDVIFPGMLVLSAAQWLDDAIALPVAIGTLIGGLVGYCALMTYVARGRPQAGLPLLNGGAILGYLITGFFFIGSEIVKFGISW